MIQACEMSLRTHHINGIDLRQRAKIDVNVHVHGGIQDVVVGGGIEVEGRLKRRDFHGDGGNLCEIKVTLQVFGVR